MSLRTGCSARQYSDEMHCHKCGLVWDVNDPDPPICSPIEHKPVEVVERPVSRERARQHLDGLKRSLS